MPNIWDIYKSFVQTRKKKLVLNLGRVFEYEKLLKLRKKQHRLRSGLQRAKVRVQNLSRSIRNSRVVVEVEEQKGLFDEEGYPLSSRDAITGRFVNPWDSSAGHHSFSDFLSWKLQRFFSLGEHKSLPLLKAPLTSDSDLELRWIGHSTCFVTMNGFKILTDPMFSDRASLVQLPGCGVPRSVPPSHSIEELPEIDVVVLSHDHYDHLDYNSIEQLQHKVKHWCVPLGFKDWLLGRFNIAPTKIKEMSWWESHTMNEITITCAPAHHWCCRNPWDRNTRLWCSWAIRSPHKNFYFTGDTALPKFPLFSQIGFRLGPFDLAAIPIGAYKPSYMMKHSHCDPVEALEIHKAIQSRKSVAIHWGTFPLADEPIEEPPELLKSLKQNEFLVISHGDKIES